MTISVKRYSDDPDINLFCVYANGAATMMYEAGKILVAKQAEDPLFRDKIKSACPGFNDATLDTFVRIGRREWHPAVVFDGDRPGNRRLLHQPYSVQEEFSNKPVTLVVSNGETVKMRVSELTKDQANQVFGPSGVRTVNEQRAYIETRKMDRDGEKSDQPFVIRGNRIVFNKKTTFSRKELAVLVAQME